MTDALPMEGADFLLDNDLVDMRVLPLPVSASEASVVRENMDEMVGNPHPVCAVTCSVARRPEQKKY